MDSAACHDCHNLHDIKKLGVDSEHREFHTKVCMKCHSDEKMMARNKVTNVAVKSYMESYHGKNYRLGFPEKVAGCADCHSAHSVLPKSDPASSVNPANLVKTVCPVPPQGHTALCQVLFPRRDDRPPQVPDPVLYLYRHDRPAACQPLPCSGSIPCSGCSAVSWKTVRRPIS